MNQDDILHLFRSQITENVVVFPVNGGYKVQLPFKDALGDHIAILVTPTPEGIILDDLGHTASLMFHLSQYKEDAPGHVLIRNLTDAYAITMDYDQGLLTQALSLQDDPSDILSFIKVLISAQTVMPELQRRKRERRGGRRLDVRLRREIHHLSLQDYVRRQDEVLGRYESWVVDYTYVRRVVSAQVDVLIVTADLRGRDPRRKAEHVLTLASDILDVADRRLLRIVYDVDNNGSQEAASRAANMIIGNQDKIGYKAYNFSDSKQRSSLISVTHQELSPLAFVDRNLA